MVARGATLTVTFAAVVASCSGGEGSPRARTDLDPPPATLAFPTAEPQPAYPTALLLGRLVERDGCLRVVRGQYETLVIWPETMSPATDTKGRIVVLGDDGAVKAVVGERIEGGGGEIPLDHLETLGARVPERCRDGPYWLLSDISTAGDEAN